MTDHYFSSEVTAESNPQEIAYEFGSHSYRFITDNGVFSVGKIDTASDILIQTIPPLSGNLLDMGCGYGLIGIVLAKEYGLELTQADINPRAVNLSKLNASKNKITSNVLQSDAFSQINGFFDTIAINPPIHAGKDVIFAMYDGAHKHLNIGGALYIVILKKHGAESNRSQILELFGNCETLYKKKGLYVFKAHK